MQRTITAFEPDDEGHFVALLDCGHRQHMRHRPLMEFRPWVLTEEGRAARIGAEIECVVCDRAEMPAGYEEYRRTAVFDATSVPKALLKEHRTQLGVWGKLVVHEGRVDYVVLEPERRVTTVHAGEEQVIVSALAHEIAPSDDARFRIVFHGAAKRSHQ